MGLDGKRRRLRSGDAASCLEAGLAYEHGGHLVPRAPVVAADLYARGCALGDERSCSARARLDAIPLEP